MRFSIGLTIVLLLFGIAMGLISAADITWNAKFWLGLIATVVAVIANHIVLVKYVVDPPPPSHG